MIMRTLELVKDLRLGARDLQLHSLRSLLTMLGMVFGVGSVVAMLSVGEGASKQALEQIRLLGSNNIILESTKPVEDEGSSQSRYSIQFYGLTYKDLTRIQQTFSNLKHVVPVKSTRLEAQFSGRSTEVRVVGTDANWFQLVKRPLLAGRALSQQDMVSRSNVVVVAAPIARDLLSLSSIIGEKIRISDHYFEVVGVVEADIGQGGGTQTPDTGIDVYIPISVMRERFGDIAVRKVGGSTINEKVELRQIILQVDHKEQVESTGEALKHMLQRFHTKEDYSISIPLALLRQEEQSKRTFNIVLGAIAGISLLVGGIGIMNIMLATVTERTREIGIRRAIGARRSQIIVQFLIETVILSTTGGLIGIGMGVLIPLLIEYFAEIETVITAFSIILSFGISVAAGIIFGLYPAIRASKLNPIEALRHE